MSVVGALLSAALLVALLAVWLALLLRASNTTQPEGRS